MLFRAAAGILHRGFFAFSGCELVLNSVDKSSKEIY